MQVHLVDSSAARRFLDHRHARAHALVVVAGEIVEDGMIYGQGTVRLSAESDRHFLRFGAGSRCVVVESGAPAPQGGVRRVLRRPELARALAGVGNAAGVLEVIVAMDWAALVEDGAPPEWLQELEARRSGGEFLRTMGVARLARLAGVSREHLSRSYARAFGTSLAAALRARRLRAGFDELTRSVRPLAEVADRCGFADQSHLTRALGEWIGLTPGALRRRGITPIQDECQGGSV